jgi:para-aminobenzoate synthetase component 1
MLHGRHDRCGRLRVTPLAGPPDAGALLSGLSDQPDPVLLESTARDERFGRYSLLACRPLDVLEVRDRLLTNSAGMILARDDAGLWQHLDEALGPVSPPSNDAPYAPGWIGYIGYEIGRTIERLPGRAPRDTALPDLRLAFYDAVLVHDAERRDWRLVEWIFDRPPQGAGQAAEALRELPAEKWHGRPAHVSSSMQTHEETTALRDMSRTIQPPPIEGGTRPKSNFTPEEYRRAVARCVDYIAAGDIFQVNLSQRLTVDDAPDALAIYRALARRNPAWYAAYLRFSSGGRDCAVMSSSPELFLRCRGENVLTRPIKGTRPRRGEPRHDETAAADLLASEKDNAELAMIIDLLRNDLGRVCRYGSVRVVERRRLEAHPTVFHLVGSVEGRLADGVGPAALLRATFPGGSITGAPKIRAMEIIDEIEPVARGVYTGCIGLVGVDGTAEWNIAIRTIVHDAGRAMIQAGGGIVADSTPDGEYHETLDKARALLEAVDLARGDAPSYEPLSNEPRPPGSG